MMTSEIRTRILSGAKRIVVKVGTAVLTRPDASLDQALIRTLCEQIHVLRTRGYTLALVSSGAIGAGIGQLELDERPTALPRLQAAAAVGQSKLMSLYDEAFARHGYHAAQLLLTREDFDARPRYVNMRNTLWALIDMGAVPVINENDTVSVDELKFGDNDILSVLVAHLLHADLLVLLTSVDGLLKPGRSRAQDEILDVVNGLDDVTLGLATSKRSKLGSGGMQSKLSAVKMALDAGEPAVIANGREKNVLVRLLEGEKLGTLFVPAAPKMRSWKRWLSFAAQPRGHIQVDTGARDALMRRGRSLLASGIIEVRGSFRKGDPVVVEDPEGNGFARGLSNYSAEDVRAIKGLQTRQIRRLFGEAAFMEVIHRNNLVLKA